MAKSLSSSDAFPRCFRCYGLQLSFHTVKYIYIVIYLLYIFIVYIFIIYIFIVYIYYIYITYIYYNIHIISIVFL